MDVQLCRGDHALDERSGPCIFHGRPRIVVFGTCSIGVPGISGDRIATLPPYRTARQWGPSPSSKQPESRLLVRPLRRGHRLLQVRAPHGLPGNSGGSGTVARSPIASDRLAVAVPGVNPGNPPRST
jgi:hypothetical protein